MGGAGPRRRATLADVAARAGVHPSLVSRVLRNDPSGYASSDTRERIRRAALELGYRANDAARGLRSSRMMALGLLLPGFSSPVYSAIAHGVEERADERGYGLVIGTHAAGDPHEAITDMVMRGRVDALLVASGRIEDQALRRLVRRLPESLVLVNRQVKGVAASVVLRDSDAAALAVRHLAELGHRRIGAVFGPRTLDTMVRRRRGFVHECTRLGLEPVVTEMDGRDHGAGFRGALRLLDAAGPPTAVVAATFPVAVGMLSAFHERGVAVPAGMSVVSLHDDAVADYLVPRLTTVMLPAARLGAEAVDLALSLIDGAAPRRVVVPDPPRLISRNSTTAL
ncbi:LacI family DNA-binding transcriptional regulator [Amycolatopsis endophytica]|uniref:LacI family transcriptional regulator n=1 Tax=Amycolatopsis endophytica TaxID=860233 RepID=A0A853B7G0_9PSEU|nr:LacI family DNA-binding transcriptional regulator [Amycolatopsis endophytica]NYI90735.1 LacI family transcriptional regulator [Amycolatopsis endophytica]